MISQPSYKRIGVMCGSSDACAQHFKDMAFEIGSQLAKNKRDIIYGAGAKGLMRRVADGAQAQNGDVFGYMPEFMVQVEWQHKKITKLFQTKDMQERKHLMLKNSDATVFLPGGSGTLEEFFEWLSSKRLGLYRGPLVLVNYQDYYSPLIKLLEQMEKEKFHSSIHSQMWSVCHDFTELTSFIDRIDLWPDGAIHTASVKP